MGVPAFIHIRSVAIFMATLLQRARLTNEGHFFADGVGGNKGRIMMGSDGAVSINAFNSSFSLINQPF